MSYMYQPGELLRFSSFEFKNGRQPKPKYFIVLGHIDDKVMMASLPTSKDHVPADAVVEHGCVNIAKNGRYPPTQNGDIRSLFLTLLS